MTKLTIAAAKEILKTYGATLSKRDGEFRVRLDGKTDYFTDDLNDAVSTAEFHHKRNAAPAPATPAHAAAAMVAAAILARFKVVEDKPVLHRSDKRGEVVVRVQKIHDTETGAITTVNFWANWENPTHILRVTSYTS